MADLNSALKVLRDHYPEAIVGVENNHIPYARMPDGKLYGILFGTPHVGDQKWEREPQAIIHFPGGRPNSSNFEIVNYLIKQRGISG